MHTRQPRARPRQQEFQFLSTFSFPYLPEFRYWGPDALQMERAKYFCFSRLSAIDGSHREELSYENSSVVRILFREKVATLHWLSLRPRRPLPPNAERTTVFCIESVEWAILGPEMQHRTFDSSGCFLVGAIVFDINRRRGSILLADSMNAGRITIGGNVFLKNLAAEGTVSEGIIEDGLGRAEQIAL